MLESEGLTKVRASWTPFAHRRETAKPSYIKQRHFQAKPKHDHAHCTLQVYIPIVPCPTITAYAEPIFKGQVTLQDEILTMSILISSS